MAGSAREMDSSGQGAPVWSRNTCGKFTWNFQRNHMQSISQTLKCTDNNLANFCIRFNNYCFRGGKSATWS